MSATALPIGPSGQVFVRGIGRAFSFQIPGRSIQLLAGPTDDHHPATTSKSINSPITQYDVLQLCRVGHRAWLYPVGLPWLVAEATYYVVPVVLKCE